MGNRGGIEMDVALLVIFSLFYILHFVRMAKRERKEIKVHYKRKYNPYDIWDDDL